MNDGIKVMAIKSNRTRYWWSACIDSAFALCLRIPLGALALLVLTVCSCSSNGEEELRVEDGMGKDAQAWFLRKMSEPPPIEETTRVSDSTGRLDAVVAIKLTNATVSTPTEVYIVKSGNEVLERSVFRAERVEDVDVRWEGENVVISSKKARIRFEAANYEVESDSGVTVTGSIRYEVLTRLPGSVDCGNR